MSRPSSIDPNNPVVREIRRRARKVPRRNRARYEAAALQTGGVESGFRELTHGDADSQNWRQERASVYGKQWAATGGPTNTRASVDRFFRELAQLDRGQPSYELAADVQRPAAQYRGRYRDWHKASLNLIRGGVPSSSSPRSVPRTRSTAADVDAPVLQSSEIETFDQAGYDQAVRKQKVASLLQSSGRGNSVLFRSGLLSSKPVDPTSFEGVASRFTQQASRPTSGGTGPLEASGTDAPAGDSLQTALREAGKYLGVREVNGSNRGKTVDKLQQGFGMIGQPWCGIYVGTVLRKAGIKVDSRVASVPEIESMARNKTGGFEGGWHSAAHARAGDALITRKGQHVAYVERVDRDGTIHVIGGNQGNGEVNRRTWKPGEVYGVARPQYGARRGRSKPKKRR